MSLSSIILTEIKKLGSMYMITRSKIYSPLFLIKELWHFLLTVRLVLVKHLQSLILLKMQSGIFLNWRLLALAFTCLFSKFTEARYQIYWMERKNLLF